MVEQIVCAAEQRIVEYCASARLGLRPFPSGMRIEVDPLWLPCLVIGDDVDPLRFGFHAICHILKVVERNRAISPGSGSSGLDADKL
jgi:hypothetical protein